MTESNFVPANPSEDDDWDDEFSTFRGGQALTDPAADLPVSTTAPQPIPPPPPPTPHESTDGDTQGSTS
jgi:hypothetical protein